MRKTRKHKKNRLKTKKKQFKNENGNCYVAINGIR